MKNFSKSILHKFSISTALGLTLGVLLAAYVVFAFDPPASAPPGGNVSPPVTIDTDQTITGLKTFNPAGLLPFTVDPSKTNVVDNLNSDQLDSLDSADLLAAAGGDSLLWAKAGCNTCAGGSSCSCSPPGPASCPSGFTQLQFVNSNNVGTAYIANGFPLIDLNVSCQNSRNVGAGCATASCTADVTLAGQKIKETTSRSSCGRTVIAKVCCSYTICSQ